MNTNLVHNILNASGLLFGMLAVTDLSTLGLSQETAIHAAAWFLLLSNSAKLLMNILRDGVTGLAANQPPVEK